MRLMSSLSLTSWQEIDAFSFQTAGLLLKDLCFLKAPVNRRCRDARVPFFNARRVLGDGNDAHSASPRSCSST